jgi:hypothetical protein
MKVLILSDNKPGHLNQSLAFVRHLHLDCEVAEVAFRSRLAKALSYLCDRLRWYPPALFVAPALSGDYCAVVSTGSETYYANKTLARRLGCKSVAIMLPRGYRYDFSLIVAQEHDRPPLRANILSLPINLCRVIPEGVFRGEPGRRYVSLIIGGNSKQFSMDAPFMRARLEEIFRLFPEHDFLVTTSRRTPQEVERILREFPFCRSFIYSQDPVNPIPDFLAISDYVFITSDSTAMISEAVSFGAAAVEILALPAKNPDNKFSRLVERLAELGSLHLFAGEVDACRLKIDVAERLKDVNPCA